ncbi:MAG: endonuclease/exonuclease/phosphatase family protein [Cyanobacteria bacterium J06598_3]
MSKSPKARQEKSTPLSYLNRINPISRFEAAPETTITQAPARATDGQTHHFSASSSINVVTPNAVTPNVITPNVITPNVITVLSWNIAKNNQAKNWSKEFLDIVEQYQPDKIFLQEVRLCTERQHLPELAPMGWSFAPNFIDTYRNTYSGILIATKASLHGSQALMTDHTEPITNTPKASLFAEYSLMASRENLLAVNTHLINFVELSKFEAQLRSLEATVGQHTGPIIFSGDFNTWNQARWQKLQQMARRMGLTAVSFNAEDTANIKSFLRSPPLDYIFYRGFNQKPNTATVISTVTSSDHNPLLVELCY